MIRRQRWFQKTPVQRSIVVGILGMLTLIISKYYDNRKISVQQFALKNPIVSPDSGIIIIAQNRAARRKISLNVEFDKLLFPNAGILIQNSNPQAWNFMLKDIDLPDSLIQDGVHHLCVNFPGFTLSEPMTFVLRKKQMIKDTNKIQSQKSAINQNDKIINKNKPLYKVTPYIEIKKVSSEFSNEDRKIEGIIKRFNPRDHEIVVYVEEPRFYHPSLSRFFNQADRLCINENDGTWTVDARPGKVYIYVLKKGNVKLNLEPIKHPLHEQKAGLFIIDFVIVK
jgi:hypothetical protein